MVNAVERGQTLNDIRDNYVWIIGSAATAVAVAIGWFISSGAVVNLVFLLIGFGITYYVQTQTQKRAWKREYSVKAVETVYGPTYVDLKAAISSLENDKFSFISCERWKSIRNDHRYFMIEEEFATRMDDLFREIEAQNGRLNALRATISKIIKSVTERVIGVGATDVNFEVKVKDEVGGIFNPNPPPYLSSCLRDQTHPKDFALKASPNSTLIEFLPVIYQPSRIPFAEKFEEVWTECLALLKKDATYQTAAAEVPKLLTNARDLRKRLEERIREPWRI